MKEEYNRFINTLMEEANEEQAFISLEYGKRAVNQTEIIANRDGLRLYIAELVRALKEDDKKEHPIKETDWYLNMYGISPQYIRIKDESRKIYQKKDVKKAHFLSKALPYIVIVLIAIIILFLMSVVVNNWM